MNIVMKSHPSWVCGLKLNIILSSFKIIQSHPSWVCGLKLIIIIRIIKKNGVTPFVGVWIETKGDKSLAGNYLVTPFVGVWIETGIG